MKRRIFIAINLPDDIRKELRDYERKFSGLPLRWTKPQNLHITLAFLGYVSDEEMLKICQFSKEVAAKHQPFFINLIEILPGPPERPRMIWASGEKSQELANLKNDLDKALSGNTGYSRESRAFSPHITLARANSNITKELRAVQPQKISLSFSVESVEVMESELKREGPEYTILETCSLGLRN